MCILFCSYKTTPGYKLVLAANRDEFLDRPAAPLDFFDEEKTVLAGRDLRGGGTWLGITTGLKFCALTNYRAPADTLPDAPSRGEILLNYLLGKTRAGDFADSLSSSAKKYNGFNLLIGDEEDLYYYSNRAVAPQLLTPGFYGLSNHLLDTPWPKVVRGKELLRPAMVTSSKIDPQRIFSLLQDSWRPPPELLPDTGVGLEREKLLGSIFIEEPGYGTRSSAVITVKNSGAVEFTEKSYHRSPVKKTVSSLVQFHLKRQPAPE